jgi:PAS domain S-box-containing protein
MGHQQRNREEIGETADDSPLDLTAVPGTTMGDREEKDKVDPRVRAYLESASVGIFIADKEGCIHLVNREAESIFGYQPEELIGQSIEILMPQQFRQSHIQHRAQYMTNPYLRHMGADLELVGRRRDGTEIAVEVSLNTLETRAETLVMGFVVDVTRQRQVEDALRKNEEILRSTIASMDDLVFILDKTGVFLKYDRPTSGRYQALLERLWGESSRSVLPEPLADQLAAAAIAVAEKGNVQQLEFSLEIEGQETWFDAKVSARTDHAGRFDGITIVSRDVTERKAVEAKLVRYADELEAQNVELDAFAHTVAHDLKTPVALLMGFAELLFKDPALQSDPVTLDTLEHIISASQQMDKIINELLLLASVRQSDFEASRLNMLSVVEEAQKRLAFISRKYRAEIILPYSWPEAMGYAPWIVEVWANYLSNAIKYGGRPPRIELGARAESGDMVRFWVKDNGAGISADGQAIIFNPFSQLRRSPEGGHGLGLSIVRKIIERGHGQVGVESEAGAGSTFWFTLPAAVE